MRPSKAILLGFGALALAASLSARAAPELRPSDSFLKTQDPAWKAFQLVFPSVESNFAELLIAVECNPQAKRVFFDGLLLSILIRANETPDSDIYALGTKVEDPFPGTDWQQWLGKLRATISVAGQPKAVELPYFGPKGKAGYVAKLTPGEMRPREVAVLRGSKAEIAKSIASQVGQAVGVPDGAPLGPVGLGVTTTGGRPVSLTFDLAGAEAAVLNGLSQSCK